MVKIKLPILHAIFRRLIHSVMTLWMVTVLFFVVTEFGPDFAVASATRGTTAEMIETLRFKLGLFASAPERYMDWFIALLSGDLGVSWSVNQPIAPLIAERLWHSTWLFGWSMLVTIPTSLTLAVMAVVWKNRLFDRVSLTLSLGAISVPDFVLAYLLLGLLGVHFDIFPAFTIFVLDMPLIDRLYASGLPLLSLMAVTITPMFRLSRAALIGVLGYEYIQMAELKGLGRWRIVLFHALPNAIGPIATAVTLSLTNLFFGLIIIEMIFSYPGLGKLLYAAASVRDVPLIQACGLISAVVVISSNLLADTIVIMSNPRIRYAGQS